MLPLTSFQNDWVSTITAQSPAHTVHYSWLELSHQVTSADVTRTCKLNVVFGHVVAGRNAKLFRNLEERPKIVLNGYGDYLTFQLTSNIASMTEDKMRALLQQLFPMIRLIADHYRRQSENMNGSFRLAPKPYTNTMT
ncbi:hypothetical protein J3E72DRAFT_270487 [Bipolaris maydis]|nr:hypothetical protein J3E72DRAFT_270487 [Bipolaris maydis]